MACRALLLLPVLLATAATGKPLAPPSRPSLRAGGEAVVVVPVPVVVVVVDEGDAPKQAAEAGVEESAKAPPKQQRPAGALSEKCMSEMRKAANDKKVVAKSAECEKKSGHAKAAFQELQQGHAGKAEAAVQEVFQQCAGISEGCAKELAPDTVLKMRFAGVTVTQSCMTKAQGLQDKEMTEPQMACQEKSTEGMVKALQGRDLQGALDEAQHGLGKCHKLEKPCDFQLAPSLVMQLLQQAAGAGEAEAGPPMQQMRVLLAQVKDRASKVIGPSGHDGVGEASLLSIAARVRLSSQTARLRL